MAKSKKEYKSKEQTDKALRVQEPAVSYAVQNRPVKTLNYLGTKATPKNEAEYIDIIRKGLSRKSLDKLMMITGLSAQEIASFIHVSDRTLRRYKPSTLLSPEQSERVIEIAELYAVGEETFGSIESFREWMDSRVWSLGHKRPKEFLDTLKGIQFIKNELLKIQYGVLS